MEEKIYENLCNKPGSSIKSICRKMKISDKNVAKCLDSLAKSGLVFQKYSESVKFYPTKFFDLLPKRFRDKIFKK